MLGAMYGWKAFRYPRASVETPAPDHANFMGFSPVPTSAQGRIMKFFMQPSTFIGLCVAISAALEVATILHV